MEQTAPTDGRYVLDGAWRMVSMNEVAQLHFGTTTEQAVGRTLWELAPGLVGTEYEAHYRQAMESGSPAEFIAPSAVRPDRRLEIRVFPVGGGLTVHFRDVTERVEWEAKLRESEARFRLLADAVPGFVWVGTPDGAIHYLNRRWYEYTGQTPEQALPHGWANTLHPEDARRTAQVWADSLAGGTTYEIELRYRRHDGVYRWYIARAEPMRDEAGAVTAWFGTSTDIHEQKRAEEHQRLLIDELNHRVKNTLAIVQGIAQQTFKSDAASAAARSAFEGRLAALSDVHNVLTRKNWEHAQLDEVVISSLKPFWQDERRIMVAGPGARLQPRTAVSLALALHELATNAVKYGALANDTGRIVVKWHVACTDEGPRLKFLWCEEGGPSVSSPRWRGFGTRMLERGLASELCGSVRLHFAPEGLRCTIDAPLNEIALID